MMGISNPQHLGPIASIGPDRGEQIAELVAWSGPAQHRRLDLPGKTLEGSATTVLGQWRERVEQRHRAGLACYRDAAVEQPDQTQRADDRDLDDRIAPEMVAPAEADNERAEDRGGGAVGVEPADRTARQPLIGAAPRQDRDLRAVVMVVAVGLGIEAADL